MLDLGPGQIRVRWMMIQDHPDTTESPHRSFAVTFEHSLGFRDVVGEVDVAYDTEGMLVLSRFHLLADPSRFRDRIETLPAIHLPNDGFDVDARGDAERPGESGHLNPIVTAVVDGKSFLDGLAEIGVGPALDVPKMKMRVADGNRAAQGFSPVQKE